MLRDGGGNGRGSIWRGAAFGHVRLMLGPSCRPSDGRYSGLMTCEPDVGVKQSILRRGG